MVDLFALSSGTQLPDQIRAGNDVEPQKRGGTQQCSGKGHSWLAATVPPTQAVRGNWQSCHRPRLARPDLRGNCTSGKLISLTDDDVSFCMDFLVIQEFCSFYHFYVESIVHTTNYSINRSCVTIGSCVQIYEQNL